MDAKTMSAMFDMAFPKEVIEIKECDPHDWIEDEVYFCKKCGCKENILVDRTFNFYDKPIAISAPYKRINHFKEQINNLCGFDNKVIPQSILDLCKDCKNQEEIKVVLQEHKLKAYYEHVYSIIKAQGKPIPYLDKREIDRLIFLFNSFLASYNKHKKLVNCISYHFILSVLLPLINRKDIVPHLYKLKNPRKIRDHMKIIKLIFTDLGWDLAVLN
jgi:hypothetical protein